jgi:Abortive infection alpha
MGDEQKAAGSVPREMVEVIEAVLEKTGVPQAIKPPASEFGEAAKPGGRALGEMFSAVSVLGRDVVVGSIAHLTFGWDYVRDFIMEDLPRRLQNVPKEQIIPPRPIVAVPTLEAIRLVGGEPELREMYANLLASSMNSQTATYAHPAFVEIIRQMVTEEARLFEYLARLKWAPMVTRAIMTQENPPHYEVVDMGYITTLSEEAGITKDSIGTSINNIIRLGLAVVHRDHALNPPSAYENLMTSEAIRSFVEAMERDGKKPIIFRHTLGLTSMGQQFAKACTTL